MASDPAGTGPSDEALVRRFVGGDSAAFTELARRHEARVYSLAYRLLGNHEDARDAAQETFVALLSKLRGFRGESAFTTWLYRVTTNACYDALRRKRRLPTPVETLPEGPQGPDPADAAATGVDVQRALTRVPEEFRAVLILHDIDGLPHEEIAAALEIPIGTVKSRLHRGRVAMGRLLAAGGEPRTRRAPSKVSEDE